MTGMTLIWAVPSASSMKCWLLVARSVAVTFRACSTDFHHPNGTLVITKDLVLRSYFNVYFILVKI